MEKPLQKIFQFLYGPFFSVLDFFMRNYRTNRTRLGLLLANTKVASFLQNAAIALLIIWILIFSFASDESRNKLTEEINDNVKGLKSYNPKTTSD